MSIMVRCYGCNDRIEEGIIHDSVAYCDACVASWATEPMEDQPDTPSLQDTNPEGHMYMTNRSYWGEDGY